ncbi:BQ2448_1976 [Microbotryum intermedium]|uniref:BQ2448_1976 protein n=1 Tax=Microbotryum intermedium TaxID=269621 RepID=A0A238FCY4_9BASI|nr:BQ2448_1976 [Microbotryum intermedium]
MIHLNRIVLDAQDDGSRCKTHAASEELKDVAEAPDSPASIAESSKAAGN